MIADQAQTIDASDVALYLIDYDQSALMPMAGEPRTPPSR